MMMLQAWVKGVLSLHRQEHAGSVAIPVQQALPSVWALCMDCCVCWRPAHPIPGVHLPLLEVHDVCLLAVSLHLCRQ